MEVIHFVFAVFRTVFFGHAPDRIACASLDFWSLSYAAAAAHGSGAIGKRCYRQTLHNCNRTEGRIKVLSVTKFRGLFGKLVKI